MGPLTLLALVACSAGERGDRAWARQDLEGAVRAYGQASNLTDQQRQRHARALLQVGDPEGAEEAMAQLSELSGDGHVVRVLLEEDPVLALALAEEGLSQTTEPSLYLSACSLALKSAAPQAFERCTEASLVLPQAPLPRLALAELSLQQGLLPSAKEWLGSLERLELSIDERLWLVALWQQAGEPERACSAGLLLGQDLYPVAAACTSVDHPTGEAMLGRLETPEAAALRLRLAVGRAQIAPPGAERARQLAIAQAALRQTGPLMESAPVLTDAARLALIEGDAERARELLGQAMRARPPELAPWLNMARLMAREGEGEGALLLLESAPSFGPTEDLALELERLQLQQALGGVQGASIQELLQRCEEAGQSRCVAEGSYLLALHEAGSGRPAAVHLDQAVRYGGASLAERALSEPVLLPVLRSPALLSWDQDPRLAEIRVQARKMPTR